MPTNHLIIGSVFIVLLIFLSTVSAQAQPSKARISGFITDSIEKKPLSFVTVNLFKRNQATTPVKSTYSDNKGRFQFPSTDTGNYSIVFTHAGFRETKLPLAVPGNLEIGTVQLGRLPITMKGVTVVGVKPLVEQEDDKIIFNVENDPDSKSAMTLDILRKTPYLTVDGEDNVLLNGKSNFKVLLNGRETSMFARNVKEALRAFPGTLISKIEVITTPPAKYDAEGVGGIINIITRKRVGGYNGSLSTFNRTGAKQNNFNASFNAKTGKIGFAVFYFVGGFKNLETRSFAETFSKVPGLFSSRTTRDERLSRNFYNGFNGELSWEIDSLNTLSAYGNINGGNGGTVTDRNIVTFFPSTPSTSSLQEIENTYSNPGFNLGTDYIKKFKGKKDKEFSMRFYGEFGKNRSIDNSKQYNPGTDRFILNNSKDEDNQLTIQSDYILPLPKNRKLESGVKAIFRKASSDFQSSLKYDPTLDFKVDPGNSDYFRYTQDIYSAYSTYSFKSKKSTYRIGSRMEFTVVDGNFVSSHTTVRQRYVNVVPFIQSITKLNPKYTLVLTYNQRLRRPYIWNLNPFVNNTDSLDIWYGNPNLGPQTIHTITPQLRYQKGPTFASVGIDVSYTNNYITDYSSFDPVTGVTRRTSDHLGRGFEYRLNSNFNTTLNPKLNFNMNGFLAFDINRVKDHPEYNSDGFGYGFNGGFNYKITPKISWAGNFSMNRNPALIQYKYPLNMWYVTMLAFKLLNDKLNLSVRATNFLRDERDFKFIAEDQYFKTTRITTRPMRGIVITTNWNFGKLKENVSKKKGVSNDDLLGNSQE